MYTCVVCGWNELEHPQYTDDGGPMFNICPCCGFQSGYHDLDREISVEEFREQWLNNGSIWKHEPKPLNWNLDEQLKRVLDVRNTGNQ